MKKSILGTIVIVAVLVLVIGDGKISFRKENEQPYESAEQAKIAESESQNEIIVIEEAQVPLAASFEESDEQNPETTDVETAENSVEEQIEPVAEQKTVEVPSCLIGGVHNTVWTDCGDYRVMKCIDCGQEIGNRAVQIADGVYGYYDDVSAALLFTRINQMRTGYQLSNELGDLAVKRALECAVNPVHNLQSDGECIAIGQADADSALAAWNASEYHRMLMLDPIYTEGGSACLWYDSGEGNMKSVWILVLD